MTDHHKTTVVSMRTDDEYDMRVDRRSPWGNPYKPANDTAGDPVNAIRCYAHWLNQPRRGWLLDRVGELQGKRIACWCAPDLCHADALALLADQVTDDPLEAADIAIRDWMKRQEDDDA